MATSSWACSSRLTRLGSEWNLPSKPEEVFNFARRTQELQVQLGFLMESEDRNTVFWIERRRGGRDKQNVFLQATPIDVAPILKTCLFDKLECAVLTSATLAVGGSFDYMRQRLGLEHAREAVLPSHFDYENQALFYVPPTCRSSHSAIYRESRPTASGGCSKSRGDGLSFYSPATRR